MRPSSVRLNGSPACSSSITAAGASRHRYSIASWSPSQSEPLTVSYMCQVQWSGPILPSDAAMPPCAATVCERVGNTLVMLAVLRPCRPHRRARPGPARPDHDDVIFMVDDLIGGGGGGHGSLASGGLARLLGR